jgi:hypothetical protein
MERIMENSTSGKKTTWPFVAILIFALLWLAAEIRAHSARKQLDALRLGAVVLRAEDAASGKSLNPKVELPTPVRGRPLPIVQVVAEENRLRIPYVAASPLQFCVSAEGYQQQTVTVTQESSPRQITVRLNKTK